MQEKITLTLTKAEFYVLLSHFRTDVEYGVNGSFGDGEDFIYWDTSNKKYKLTIGTKEYNIGKRIVKKLEREL